MRYTYCAWVAVDVERQRLSVTLTGVCDSVDLASPSIKRNLNICQGTGTIDDAVGLFQNIINATLIILENDSTMSCKKT